MIDWWASKTGMIVFVAILSSILLLLVNIESSAFRQEEIVRNANNIALLIDAASSKSGSTEYSIKGTEDYNIAVFQNSIKVSSGSIVADRYFLADAQISSFDVKGGETIVIEKTGGSVNVRKK